MENFNKKSYGKIAFYCCYALIILIDIIYSICVPEHNFTTGFLSILLAIEFPYLKNYLSNKEYHSAYITSIILSFSISIYFLSEKNILSTVIMFIVGILIIMRKNTDINH